MFALLVGHLPKFMAIFLGTDTDFQGLFRVRPRDLQWLRGGLALAPLVYLVVWAVPSAGANIDKVFYAFDVLNILKVFWDSVEIWLSLFVAQLVFSWPDPDIDFNKRRETVFVDNDDPRFSRT